MNLEGVSDEELELLATGHQDNLGRQRARSKGVNKYDVKNLADEDLEALATGGGSTTPLPRRDVPRETSRGRSWALTSYGPTMPKENMAGPLSRETQEADRRTMEANTGKGYVGDESPPFTERERSANDPIAHDPIAQMVLSGTLGMGAGALVGPAIGAVAGRAAGAIGEGAVSGAAQALTGGGGPEDVLTATLLGAGQRGLQHALPGGSPPRVPRTQAELDAAALKAAPPQREGLPEGAHGTIQLATEAEARLRGAVASGIKEKGAALDAADAEFAALDRDHPPVQTEDAISRIENIRKSTHGGAGPTLDSDPALHRAQRQLTSERHVDPALKDFPLEEDAPIPREVNPFDEVTSPSGYNSLDRAQLEADLEQRGIQLPRSNNQTVGGATVGGPARQRPTAPSVDDWLADVTAPGASAAPTPSEAPTRVPEISRAHLRNVQKALNEEANFAARRGATMSEGALQQGAGVVASTARNADPTGRLGQALDEYGRNTDRIAAVEKQLGPEGSFAPRVARTGQADASDTAGLAAERQTGELQQREPVSNDLIDMIRARNIQGRRGLQFPSYMGGNPTMGAFRALRANASNLNFKLRPPKIDESGMVAGRSPSRGAEAALPLEIQLMLMEDERRRAEQ